MLCKQGQVLTRSLSCHTKKKKKKKGIETNISIFQKIHFLLLWVKTILQVVRVALLIQQANQPPAISSVPYTHLKPLLYLKWLPQFLFVIQIHQDNYRYKTEAIETK